MPFIIILIIVAIVVLYFTLSSKEKRSINKHKKNQNYKSNVTQSKADNKNQTKDS